MLPVPVGVVVTAVVLVEGFTGVVRTAVIVITDTVITDIVTTAVIVVVDVVTVVVGVVVDAVEQEAAPEFRLTVASMV